VALNESLIEHRRRQAQTTHRDSWQAWCQWCWIYSGRSVALFRGWPTDEHEPECLRELAAACAEAAGG